MGRKVLQVAVCTLLLTCAAASGAPQEPDLAAKLPAGSTVLFAWADLGDALDAAERALLFVDEETGGKIVYQVGELYGLLRELAAHHEFQPMLFDVIEDADLYLLVMLKDEPEVVTRTDKVLDFDAFEALEGGDPPAVPYKEVTREERIYFTSSLVIEAPDEEVAADFLIQFKQLFDFVEEGRPEGPQGERRDVEVERGEMIEITANDSDQTMTLGRLENYIVFSDRNPKEFWGAIMAPPEDKVSGTALYQRIMGAENAPQAVVAANIRALTEMLESSLKLKVEELTGRGQEEGAEAGGMQDFEMIITQQLYQAFVHAKNVLSLDKIEQAGFSVHASTDEERTLTDARMLLSHGLPISVVLRELLDGSGEYALPPTATAGRACAMARVSLKTIYDDIIRYARATSGQQGISNFDMSMQMMKMMFGADLADITGMLDSDLYVFVEMVEKEMEFFDYAHVDDEEGFQMETTARTVPWPKATLLWGVRDANAARALLNSIATRLSANPQTNAIVKKRTYQETDVYCFGMDAAREESYPDGMSSFALIVAGRYLTMGSWEYVTDVIRQMKSGQQEVDAELAAVVEKHRSANLILVAPREFQQKAQDLSKKLRDPDEGSFSLLRRALDELEMEFGDAELEQRITTAIEELLAAFEEFGERQAERMPETTVATGKHEGTFYVIQSQSEMTK